MVLGLLWCNVGFADNCHDYLKHEANYNQSNTHLKFEFKSTSNKTIKIYDWGLLSKSGDYMKKTSNPFYVRPYSVITKDLYVGDLNLDVAGRYQYYCTFETKTTSQKKSKKKKKGGFKWWYILVGLGILMAIGAIMEQAEKKRDSKKSTKTSSTTSTSSGSFIEDVWKGKKSLGETFWLYYIVVNGVITFGAGFLMGMQDNNIFFVAAIASNIWTGVGTWNSSTNYQLQKIKAKQPHGWAYAAKVLIVMGFISLVAQAIELFNL